MEVLQDKIQDLTRFLPRIVAAIAILVIGWWLGHAGSLQEILVANAVITLERKD